MPTPSEYKRIDELPAVSSVEPDDLLGGERVDTTTNPISYEAVKVTASQISNAAEVISINSDVPSLELHFGHTTLNCAIPSGADITVTLPSGTLNETIDIVTSGSTSKSVIFMFGTTTFICRLTGNQMVRLVWNGSTWVISTGWILWVGNGVAYNAITRDSHTIYHITE